MPAGRRLHQDSPGWEAFALYRAVLDGSPEAVREAAWAEVAEVLEQFESEEGFVAPAEVLVAGAATPA